MKDRAGLAAIRSRAGEQPENSVPGAPGFTLDNALGYIAGNVDKDIAHISRAASLGADLACTVEAFAGDGQYMNDYDCPGLFKKVVGESEKIIETKISEAAKKFKIYVAANFYTKNKNKIYNTAVLFGRNGDIAGKYYKVHLPAGEARVVSAGNEFPVFETDFGRIGFATCYDVLISEQFRILALSGADIICHQSMAWGPDGRGVPEIGDAYHRTRANENSVVFVVANNITKFGGRSAIIDQDGNFLAEAGGMEEGLAYAEVSTDYDRADPYFYDNYFTGIESTRARQFLTRRPELYGALTDKNVYAYGRDARYSLPSPERVAEIAREHNAMDKAEQKKYFWGK